MINVVPSQKSQSLCVITDHSKSIAQTQYTPVMFPHSERQVAVVSVQEKDGGEENGTGMESLITCLESRGDSIKYNQEARRG